MYNILVLNKLSQPSDVSDLVTRASIRDGCYPLRGAKIFHSNCPSLQNFNSKKKRLASFHGLMNTQL
jgi:hypothetical protein